jgi:hypothetical protein
MSGKKNAKLLKDCSLFKSLLLLFRGICLNPLAYSTFKINLSAVMFPVLLYLSNPLVSSLIVSCAIFLSPSFVCIHVDSSSDSLPLSLLFQDIWALCNCVRLSLSLFWIESINPATDLRKLISGDFILLLLDRSVVQFSQQ